MNSNKLPSVLRETCGTYSGYQSHSLRNEIVCADCLKARKDYRRKDYYKNHEKNKTKNREWVKNNPEKIKASRARWRQNHSEQIKEAIKNARKAKPEKYRLIENNKARRRRALKQSTKVDFYTDQQVLDLYGINCHICHLPIDLSAPRSCKKKGWENGLHIDHVIPISKGGSDTIENVRPAHGICNIRKGAN